MTDSAGTQGQEGNVGWRRGGWQELQVLLCCGLREKPCFLQGAAALRVRTALYSLHSSDSHSLREAEAELPFG